MATTTTTPSFQIKGKSGKVYTFYIHKWPTNFEKGAGVYLFTKEMGNGTLAYLYLGITKDFGDRFDGHHKMQCITKNGATHICAFLMEGEANRENAEKDILAVIKTTCNDLLN